MDELDIFQPTMWNFRGLPLGGDWVGGGLSAPIQCVLLWKDVVVFRGLSDTHDAHFRITYRGRPSLEWSNTITRTGMTLESTLLKAKLVLGGWPSNSTWFPVHPTTSGPPNCRRFLELCSWRFWVVRLDKFPSHIYSPSFLTCWTGRLGVCELVTSSNVEPIFLYPAMQLGREWTPYYGNRPPNTNDLILTWHQGNIGVTFPPLLGPYCNYSRLKYGHWASVWKVVDGWGMWFVV